MASSVSGRAAFLVTIDTEGDDMWSRPRLATTENARFLPHFQTLCERFGLRPTYLTTWEMCYSPAFQEFGRDVIRRGAAELGAHLHAWGSPPHSPLTEDDSRYQPYLMEYPPALAEKKLTTLTSALEETFETPMRSHRAGRWGLTNEYVRFLAAAGYRVDCSVTPRLSWRSMPGSPHGTGGPDYSDYPTRAYRMDLRDARSPGSSSLVEVPVTTFPVRYRRSLQPLRGLLRRSQLASAALNRVFPQALWLRPDGRNAAVLPSLLEKALAEGREYVQLTLHSSELMPGGSPRFRSAQSIERLYDALERLFEAAQGHFVGRTLNEFRDEWASRFPPDTATCSGT
jgi:hypothetical protein